MEKKGSDAMARTGRPIIGKKKDCDIRVRIDEDLNDTLLDYCDINNIKRASVIRMAIEKFLKN